MAYSRGKIMWLLRNPPVAKSQTTDTISSVMKKHTFDQWMSLTNQHIEAIAGVSASDLPDCCYHDWYEDGKSPLSAAKKAIRMANDDSY